MNKESGVRTNGLGKWIGDMIRGHTLQQEKDVKRIITDFPSICSRDVEEYKTERLRREVSKLFPSPIVIGGNLPSPYPLCPTGLQRELNRLENLTPQEIATEMQENAKQKAKEWKLKINV